MKNSKNKKNSFRKTMSYLIFITILIFISCKNDDDNDKQQNCGCDSETIFTIPNEELQVPIEEQKSGLLFYKHPEDIDNFYNNDEYKNRFWIFRKTSGCNICETYFIICNEELLGTDYDYLKQENIQDSIPIQFSGNLKQLCHLKATPVAYSYSEIVLTEISQQ
jgi:hypothetical protein